MLTKFMIYLSFIFILLSCAKDKAYEPVFKEKEVIPKSLISTSFDASSSKTYNRLIEGDNPRNQSQKGYEVTVGDNVYLYIPMAESGSYHSEDVFPYMQGNPKLVTFEFTKDSLVVNAMEREERFQDNIKPIMEIPILHLDYRCKENSYDECSNEEELNDDISWRDKKFVELKFEGIQLAEFNSISGFHQELINELYGCNQTIKQEIKSWKITESTVDIVVARTMKKSILCSSLREMSDLDNLSYVVDHHYQFKKLNSIASENYKPVLYPKSQDDNVFGFFKESYKNLSSDNRVLNYSEKIFLKRFNPEKKNIVYHLSEDLFSPEFSDFLQATREGVDSINKSLKEAGAGIKIVLSNTPREKVLHEVHNSIILVKEPFAAGPLGYGPSVGNPLNGEILQAQTVMYYGNLLWTIESAYNDLLTEVKLEIEKKKKTQEKEKKTALGVLEGKKEQLKSFVEIPSSTNLSINPVARDFNNFTFQEYLKSPFSQKNMMERVEHELNRREGRVSIFSKFNVYSGEYLSISKMIKNVENILGTKREFLKPWHQLGDHERKKLISLIAPKIWKSTLVHELGHNLGLRHNFSGSEDKNNFYTTEELAKFGIEDEIPYSSVMDYSKGSLNDLPMMGKYDIAALKFGYARKVEMLNGKEQKIGVTLGPLMNSPERKRFAYCSDEGVYLNATCNRFDEGTKLDEIVDSYIDAYKKFYKRLNFKNDRLKFSSYDGFSHFVRNYHRTFFPLRKVFDTFEKIYHEYILTGRIAPDDPEILPYLVSVVKVADFMMSVINTDDLVCKIFDREKKETLMMPISSSGYSSCENFQKVIPQDKYLVIAKAGKTFNDMRSPFNPEVYTDQIDVRGHWMDKVLALKVLLQRDHGITSLDDYTENFVSLPVQLSTGETVKSALKSYMNKLIDGKATKELTFEPLVSGIEETKEVVSLDLSDSFYIPSTVDQRMNYVFGLKRGKTHFIELVINSLKDSLGPFDNGKQNNLVKDYLVSTSKRADFKNPVEVITQYGNFFFESEAKGVASILEKMEASELIEGKHPVMVSTLGQIRTQLDNADGIMKEFVSFYQKQATGIYSGNKKAFNYFVEIGLKKLKSFKNKVYDEIDNEELIFLSQQNESTIDAAITAEAKSGEEIALHVVYSIAGNPQDYDKVIALLINLKYESTLKSLIESTVNTKGHYEKIISSMARAE